MNTPVEGYIVSNSPSEEIRDLQIGENLIRLANSNDTKGFLSLLTCLKHIDLTQIVDKKLYTCKQSLMMKFIIYIYI